MLVLNVTIHIGSSLNSFMPCLNLSPPPKWPIFCRSDLYCVGWGVKLYSFTRLNLSLHHGAYV